MAEATDCGASSTDPLLGRVLAGKYRLDALLGSGGMGGVYRAHHLALDKRVAVKVLHRDLSTDPLFVGRFYREARASSRLDHPNTIRTFDFGEEPDGLLYLAMELLEGRDLLTVLNDDAPLPAARVVDIVCQTLFAVDVAHEAGIVHRDLKPENILLLRRRGPDGLDEEIVKVCDFGIAQMADTSTESGPSPSRAKKGKLTSKGLVIGTPEYMSPEQARGEPLDARTDVYSIGVVLYLLLTGRTPFDGSTPMQIVLRHQNEEPQPPSAVAPGIDPGLEAVCLKALRKRPLDRFASARVMRAALRTALNAVQMEPRSDLSGRRAAPSAQGGGGQKPSEAAVTLAMGTVERYPAESAPPAGTVVPSPSLPTRRRRAWLVAAVMAAAASWPIWRTRLAERPDFSVPQIPLHAPVEHEPPPAPIELPLSAAPVANMATAPHAVFTPRPVAPGSPGRELNPDPSSAPPSMAPAAALGVGSEPAVVLATALSPPPAAASAPAPRAAPAAAYTEHAGSVTVGEVAGVLGGVRSSEIRALVREALPSITECYRALTAPSTLEGAYGLSVATDDDGNIQPGVLEGPWPPAMKACIAGTLHGKLRPDTGTVNVRVRLSFSRP